jgi:uncharacterized protein
MIGDISKDTADFILKIARNTIIKEEKKIWLSEKEILDLPDVLKEKRGGFVTIQKNGNLRGCIGYILPMYPLYQTVIENAYNAAYSDPRFSPVMKNEINDLHIEISVLTVPGKIFYKDSNDLLAKLNPFKDGVIIKKGFYSATFLPQVWEQLPNKTEFLKHLCMKAGFDSDEWEKNLLDVEIYHAEVFEEDK